MSEGPRIPRQATGFSLEQLDGEMLLHSPGSAKAVYCNEAASLIWRLCDGQRTTAEIAQLVRDAFPESAEAIDEQVDRTIQRFLEHGAVEFV